MSSIIYLRNRNTGRVYAYLNESTWDSEKKRCICKRKCLGHVDPETGDIVPNRGNREKEYAVVRTIGPKIFLQSIARSIGLEEAMKRAFPDSWELLLSCAFYILCDPMDNFSKLESWSVDCDTPYGKPITAPMLTERLEDISENNLFIFFREWRDQFEGGFYMFHESSISSYDSRTSTIRFNDLPEIHIDPMTHISFVYNEKTRLPISYEITGRSPVSLTDIRRRESEVSWLDFSNMTQILDMNYYSKDNIDDLLRSNHRFLIRILPEEPFARDSIERVRDKIMDLKNYKIVDEEPFFVMSYMSHINGKKCYTHIIFSSSDAEREFSLFLSLIDECQKELESKIFIPEHKEFYEKYFIITDGPGGRTIEENGEAIMSYNTVAGFIVLLSNSIKSPETAFRHYLHKDRVQKYFENLRNFSDRLDLKLFLDANFRGRIFLQFISMILYSEIRRKLENSAPLKDLTIMKTIHSMESLKKISIPGFDTPFFTNINNTASRILKAFNIDPDSVKKI